MALTIDVNVESVDFSGSLERVEHFVREIAGEIEVQDGDVSILFCDDEFIRDLNTRFRNKDEATDVLSFSQNDGYDMGGSEKTLFGDIVISLETLAAQAREYGVAQEEELKRLLIHGTLHLYGLDHEGNSTEEEPMLVRQEEILRRYGRTSLF